MSKPTPGPWKLFTRNTDPSNPQPHTTYVLMQRKTRQHLMYVDEAPGMGDQGAANFRLLESASDVLESLKELAFIVESVAHLQGRERELLPAADKARELIDMIELSVHDKTKGATK